MKALPYGKRSEVEVGTDFNGRTLITHVRFKSAPTPDIDLSNIMYFAVSNLKYLEGVALRHQIGAVECETRTRNRVTPNFKAAFLNFSSLAYEQEWENL